MATSTFESIVAAIAEDAMQTFSANKGSDVSANMEIFMNTYVS